MTAFASSAVTPTPAGVAALDGTAGTTAEPDQVRAHVDDQASLAGGPSGPAVQSQTKTG